MSNSGKEMAYLKKTEEKEQVGTFCRRRQMECINHD